MPQALLILAPLIITIGLYLLYTMLNHASLTSNAKSAPFECGLDPKINARTPFSARYFLLAVVFLVFDVETALLISLPLSGVLSPITLTSLNLFVLILILGLIHEWREQTLNWTN